MPDWSRIHRERRWGLGTVPLAFCSAIYGLGVRLRLAAYATNVFRGKTLPGFVVSVGNLTAGGTGKTPAVIMLAQWALGQGRRVAVLSRGYGSQNHRDILEVSDGQGRYADVLTAGDEPSLMARAIPESPVIISRSRYRAGIHAHNRFGSDFFILDDGFQHLQLTRDLDMVLMDAIDPFGNGHLLPWGSLREPVKELSRADAFILTRFSRGQNMERGLRGIRRKIGQAAVYAVPRAEKTLAFLKERFPSAPVFCADHCPDKVVFPATGEVHEPGFLENKGVVAFAGIAHPEYFRELLVSLGVEVIRFRGFRDHSLFSRKDLEDMIHAKEAAGARYLLTTEKDWMRIAPFAPGYVDLAYLRIRFTLLPGQHGFFRMIRDDLKE
ncbi:MAG TPA: tetraacyldisaccharide 4'-kinase [Desulfobacteraceae bacterium]|nr:tetraacyldisaccharide 4'-kinase [Desulfobacteraceae bacterium]